MRVYDLTHTISEDILVWPGTEQPRLSEGSTFERDGFRETRLELFSHVGTHMDAPAHMLAGASSTQASPRARTSCSSAPAGTGSGTRPNISGPIPSSPPPP